MSIRSRKRAAISIGVTDADGVRLIIGVIAWGGNNTMSNEPKPNIRPGVRGICRNGFWTPPLEVSSDENWPWAAGGISWTAKGHYFTDETDHGRDIIRIVEDLPPVLNPQPVPQIPGMPDGWEVDPERKTHAGFTDGLFIPIRRITPPEPVTPPRELIGHMEQCLDEAGGLPSASVGDWNWKKLLEDANQALRSAYSIAERDGKDTGWPEWRARLQTILKEQHAALWPKPPEPVCTWQHGVFRDGWLTPGKDKGMFRVHLVEPGRDELNEMLMSSKYYLVDGNTMINPPKFRDDVPWDQRCVKVGPKAEKGLSCP